MSRPFRLTRQAEASLRGIAEWTRETFGARQADVYLEELIERCEAICSGTAVSRSCAALLPDAADVELRYAHAGAHYVVFLDRPEAVIVVDVLHGRCDLPRHLAILANRAATD